MRQVASEGDAYSFLFNVTRAGSYELQVGAPNADGSVNGSVQVQGSPSSLIAASAATTTVAPPRPWAPATARRTGAASRRPWSAR